MKVETLKAKIIAGELQVPEKEIEVLLGKNERCFN